MAGIEIKIRGKMVAERPLLAVSGSLNSPKVPYKKVCYRSQADIKINWIRPTAVPLNPAGDRRHG